MEWLILGQVRSCFFVLLLRPFIETVISYIFKVKHLRNAISRFDQLGFLCIFFNRKGILLYISCRLELPTQGKTVLYINVAW